MFGHMPNVTPVQLIAALTWVASQAVAAGWIDGDASKRYVSIGSTVITSVWIAGDAILRGFRNIRKAAEAKAGTPTP
jgi:hypothetical protein